MLSMEVSFKSSNNNKARKENSSGGKAKGVWFGFMADEGTNGVF